MSIIFACNVLALSTTAFAQPKIDAFFPATGKIGSRLTVTGSRFPTDLSSVAVYVGGVKALVSRASSDTVEIMIPAGTSTGNIAITDLNDGTTAHSATPFRLLFDGAPEYTRHSIADQKEVAASMGVAAMVSADFDGDGRPDLATANSTANSVSIFRNRSTTDSVILDNKVEYFNGRGGEASAIAAADIDGDGLIDLAVTYIYFNTVVVYHNESTPASLRFSVAGEYNTALNPSALVIEDLSGDGRPDIAVAHSAASTISVFKNTSSPGTIGFNDGVDVLNGTENYSNSITAGDIDGDGLADLAIANTYSMTGTSLSVLLNNASTNDISFLDPVEFTTGSTPFGITLSDMNNDGKPELITANGGVQVVSVLENQSIAGQAAFALPKEWHSGEGVSRGLVIMDGNGDGEPDIALVNDEGSKGNITLLCHDNDPTLLSFRNPISFVTGSGSSGLTVPDLTGDGRPEWVSANLGAGSISVLRNRSGQYATVTACVLAETKIQSSVKGNSYQWQMNKGAGFNDMFLDAVFKGTKDSVLVIAGTSQQLDGYQFRCYVEGVYSTIYVLSINGQLKPSVEISASAVESCQGYDVSFNASVTNGGSSPSYSWLVNGVPTGVTDPFFTTAQLNDQDKVSVEVKVQVICTANPILRSVALPIRISPVTNPTGKIAAPAQACTREIYHVRYTGTSTPSGSQVLLWEARNDGTYWRVDARNFQKDTLDFSIDGDSIAGKRKFFFTMTPPMANACSIDGSTDTATIDFRAATVPQLDWSNNLLSVIAPDAAYTYRWQIQNATGNWSDVSATATGITFKPQASATYRVMALWSGCTIFSAPRTILFTGLGGLPATAAGIQYFPNPATVTFTIDHLNPADRWTQLSIYSTDGNRVYFQDQLKQTRTLTIPIAHLGSGSYIFYLERKDGLPVYGKFVKL